MGFSILITIIKIIIIIMIMIITLTSSTLPKPPTPKVAITSRSSSVTSMYLRRGILIINVAVVSIDSIFIGINFTFQFCPPIHFNANLQKIFFSVWDRYYTRTTFVTMDQHIESNYKIKSNDIVRAQMKEINDEENPNKCNQCKFSSLYASDLRTHLKTHNGEKPNKCDQCDFASSFASSLGRHLNTHNGQKSN